MNIFYNLGEKERAGIENLLSSGDPSLVEMGKTILDSFGIDGLKFYRVRNMLIAYKEGMLTPKEFRKFLERTYFIDEKQASEAMEILRSRKEFPMIDPSGSSEKLYQDSLGQKRK